METQNLQTVTTEGEIKETGLQTSQVDVDMLAIEGKLEALATMQKGLSLTPRYMEFSKVGDTTRGIFLGFKILTKKEGSELKRLTCAVWADQNKDVWCNAGVSFVSGFITENHDGTVSELPKYTAFQADLIELKATGAGKVKVFSISRLS